MVPSRPSKLVNKMQQLFNFFISASLIHPQSASSIQSTARKSGFFLSPQLELRRKNSDTQKTEMKSSETTQTDFKNSELGSGSCPSLVDPPPSDVFVPSVDFPFQFNFGSTFASSITLFFDN